MDADRERRMEALRARVQAKKEAGMLQPAEDELVITSAEVEELAQQTEATSAEDDWMAMIDRDGPLAKPCGNPCPHRQHPRSHQRRTHSSRKPE